MTSVIATDWEARALAEGRLTAFVRPVVPQPILTERSGFKWMGRRDGKWWLSGCGFSARETANNFINSRGNRFVRPGDTLDVKETWCNHYPFTPDQTCQDGPCYKATDYGECGAMVTGQRWRSGATMPAWAVRWHLPVDSVGVKRARDITEEEARACGVVFRGGYWDGAVHPIKETPKALTTAVEALRSLYDSHWSKRGYPWGDNHWVWLARVAQAAREVA